MQLREEVSKIKGRALGELEKVKDLKILEDLRVKYLGRKGELTAVLKSLVSLTEKEKREIGAAANRLKSELENLIAEKVGEFKQGVLAEAGRKIDVTRPGFRPARGALHPLTEVRMQIENISQGMGFSVIEGPELETEWYNFDALNIPVDHPARDLWDTFWLKQPTIDNRLPTTVKDKTTVVRSQSTVDRFLLRTHTSPMQARYMENHNPPFRIVVPGRVFRYEATDASHNFQFYQIEGLMVGKDVSIANFQGIISEFFKKLFVKEISIRLRPSFFSFVEPGFEVDVSCVKCDGKSPSAGRQGCSVCGSSGWLEVMGAGMVHPNVFKAAGYNPGDWQGFAFGLGLDRIAMIKYGIDDIRLFYQNDLRFLRQF